MANRHSLITISVSPMGPYKWGMRTLAQDNMDWRMEQPSGATKLLEQNTLSSVQIMQAYALQLINTLHSPLHIPADMILPQNGLGSCQSESKLLCYFGAFRNYRLQYSYSCSYNHSAKTDHHWDVGRGMLPKTFAFFRQWCSATRKFCAVPSTISNQDHQQFEDLPQTRLIFQLSV